MLTRRKAIRSFKGRGRGKDPQKGDGYRINRDIVASEVRLIDDEGKMLGVMGPAEALAIAENKGLDLIEIAPNAKPPTCKIMDYGKWKYENKKKTVAARKKQTVIVIKEVQVRPRTEQHDLDVKLRHARRFLLEGDKVKLNLRFSGREMAHQDIGVKVLETCSKQLDDIAVVEQPAKREGRHMFVMLAPDPAKIKEYEKAQKNIAKDKADAEPAPEEIKVAE